MGQGIVYCESCGERLLEADFEKGQAVTVLNKHYCSRCKTESAPTAAPGVPTPRPGGGTRIRAASPTRNLRTETSRIPRPATSSSFPLVAGAVVVLSALGLMGWFLFRGEGAPDPAPRATGSTPRAGATPGTGEALAKAQEALKRLKDLAALPSTSAEDLQKEVEKTRPLVKGTRLQREFDEIVSEAARRRRELEVAEGVDGQLRKVAEIRAADREFGRRAEVTDLLGKIRLKVEELAPDRKDELARIEQDYQSAFIVFCQERYDQVIAAVDVLVRAESYQDAITTIERSFPPHLRGSSYWPDLERRINQYKVEAQKKAATPTPAPTPTRAALPREDMPPVGKEAVLFDGKSMDRLARYLLPNEKEESWRVEKGELVGESSNPSTDEKRFYDPVLTRADNFEYYELEFEAKVEKGNLVLIGRMDADSNLGGFAQIQEKMTANWTKFRFVWSQEGFTGARDGGPPVKLQVGKAGRGRLGFALQPGTKAFLRNVKVTPKN